MQWRPVRKQPQVCHLWQGIGLRSAFRLREAAHWASWANTMKMVWARHPDIAETIMQAVNAHDDAPSVQAINRSRESLVAVGFTPPTWEELVVSETAHPPHVADGEPNQPRVGWQAQAAREVGFVRRRRCVAQVPRWAIGRIALLVWNHNFSGCCSFVVCVSLSLSQPVPADVAVLSTSLAIIGRPVLLLGRWDAEGSLSRMRHGDTPASHDVLRDFAGSVEEA